MSTTQRYDFESTLQRRETHSAKWGFFDEEVLPMWVADMDFKSPPEVLEALHARIEHGCFGYTFHAPELQNVICERMQGLYGWEVQPEEILFLPGLVFGLNLVNRTFGQPGDGTLVRTPVYGPFLSAPANNGKFAQMVDLVTVHDDAHTFRYEIDFDALEAAITQQTSLFMLCSPHNPTGRNFNRDELHRSAELALKHDLILVSDEIHCDLQMDGRQHIPTAALSPEVAQRTITLMAPSKTFNIPGLGCSFAIVQNAELRQTLNEALWRSGAHVNIMGFTAALAAYQHGDPWLTDLLGVLQEHRDSVVTFVRDHLSPVKTTVPEATYLAWLDLSDPSLQEGLRQAMPDNPDWQRFFVERGRVALNPGHFFGPSGRDYLRLNFGTPHHLLSDGLERIKHALETLG